MEKAVAAPPPAPVPLAPSTEVSPEPAAPAKPAEQPANQVVVQPTATDEGADAKKHHKKDAAAGAESGQASSGSGAASGGIETGGPPPPPPCEGESDVSVETGLSDACSGSTTTVTPTS